MCLRCRAAPSKRRAMSTRLLLDKTGTITLGNRQATEFKPLRGVSEQELADAAQLASLADETPEGRSIVVLAKEKYGISGRDLAELRREVHPVHRAEPHVRRRGRRLLGPQGRGGLRLNISMRPRPRSADGAVRGPAADRQRRRPCAKSPRSRSDRQVGRHAARRRQGRQAARRGPSQGRRQGRHPRALRRAAADGHPHRHDHRRQSDDGRRHCGGGRRRRFPRPGDARGQAQLIREEQANGKLVAMCGDGTNDAPRWRRRMSASP